MRTLTVILMLAACGAPPARVERTPAVLVGDYDGWLRPLTTEGDCGFLPDGGFGGGMHFDANGNAASPFPGVDCTTDYDSTAHLMLKCHGYGSKLEADADFSRFNGGVVDLTEGPGLATGDIGGCTKVKFFWQLWVKK